MVAKSDAELDAMSIDQIRELAMQETAELEAEAAKVSEKQPEAEAEVPVVEAEAEVPVVEAPPVTEQPRGADGKFAKKEEPVVVPPVVEEPGDEDFEYITERRIDLGDGSGIQVFVGRGETELAAQMNLTDQLVVAQENATRKIREQNEELGKKKAADAQAKIDEDFVESEEYKKDPRGATKRMIERQVAATIAERDATAKRHLQAQLDFVAIHPDYVPDPKNGNAERLTAEFRRLYPTATEFTVTGLDKAYESLKQSGLLVLKAPEASAPTTTVVKEKVEETPRIEETPTTPVTPVPPVRSPRRASSVSSTHSGTPVVKTDATEDELYSMSMDKLTEELKNPARWVK
jgi:hypothetical protein